MSRTPCYHTTNNSVASSKRAASLERPGNKVDNHGLGNNTIRRADPLANEAVMDLVLLDVKVPIGHRVELHDEDVREAILPTVSVWSTGENGLGAPRTLKPSMDMSLPPWERAMYGFPVEARTHWSLRPSTSSQHWGALVMEGSLRGTRARKVPASRTGRWRPA